MPEPETLPVSARADLPERSIHWLRGLLHYCLPPAKVLELGSAHGGYVAMMRWAGFQATGLDLSPSTVADARPLEVQAIPPASLDAIVLMDVLEHLGEPKATLRLCRDLLKPEGKIFIQTPRYGEGESLALMQNARRPFLEMLIPEQHLFLFSKSSVKRMFSELGIEHVAFQPAIFPDDMALVASRAPLEPSDESEVFKSLAASPGGRLVQALLDLDLAHLERRDAEVLALTKLYRESEADRAARIESLLKMERLYADQSKRLAESEANLQDKARENSSLTGHLAMREAQLHLQACNLRELAQSSERARRRHSLEAAASAKAKQDLQAETVRQKGAMELHGRRLAALEGLLGRLKSSYVFRLMRRFQMWGWLEEKSLETAVDSNGEIGRAPRKVVIDLTPVLPGVGNGGAKVMTLELIRHLGKLAPECNFILLTSAVSHDELATLDAANIRRLCVQDISEGLEELGNPGHPGESLVRRLSADLLFCPFTAPYYFDPSVPTVSVVYDLQYAYYPQFFESSEIQERDRDIRRAVSAASAVVCISDHVRATLLEKMTVSADRVETIHITVPGRLGRPSSSQCESALKMWGLTEGSFLLYPADFWPHKNHEILLTAFGIYLAHHPGSEIKLVLTGASGPRRDFLQEAVSRMGLTSSVMFAGYLREEQLSALLHSCLALIFPSLFEGFGMPLLEAMAAGRPVLCSNSTSLPEVAGDAAIYFDPRVPAEISEAIARIASEPALRQRLSARAAERLALFGGPETMGAAYLKTFQRALSGPWKLHRGSAASSSPITAAIIGS